MTSPANQARSRQRIGATTRIQRPRIATRAATLGRDIGGHESAIAVTRLIYRNIASAATCIVGVHPDNEQIDEGAEGRTMSNATQAFLLTGEVFALSFVSILLFWLADKLRAGFLAKR